MRCRNGGASRARDKAGVGGGKRGWNLGYSGERERKRMKKKERKMEGGEGVKVGMVEKERGLIYKIWKILGRDGDDN